MQTLFEIIAIIVSVIVSYMLGYCNGEFRMMQEWKKSSELHERILESKKMLENRRK